MSSRSATTQPKKGRERAFSVKIESHTTELARAGKPLQQALNASRHAAVASQRVLLAVGDGERIFGPKMPRQNWQNRSPIPTGGDRAGHHRRAGPRPARASRYVASLPAIHALLRRRRISQIGGLATMDHLQRAGTSTNLPYQSQPAGRTLTANAEIGPIVSVLLRDRGWRVSNPIVAVFDRVSPQVGGASLLELQH